MCKDIKGVVELIYFVRDRLKITNLEYLEYINEITCI